MGTRLLGIMALLVASCTAPVWCDPVQRLPGSPPLVVNPDRRPGDDLQNDSAQAILQARQRIAAGDMKTAVRNLLFYVFNHPSDVDAKRFLGDLYFRTGDIARAEELYGEILRDYPKDRETHNRLGTAYAAQNRVNDAIHEFEASLPGTDSVGDLVQLHLRRGDLPAYKRDMERLATAYPTDPDMQSELGQVYEAMHQPDRAVVYFQRALDTDQNSLTALNGLGLSLMDMHNYKPAIAAFHKCLNIEAQSFQCLDNIGAAELEYGDLDSAQHMLDRAHALAPERPEPLVNFGYMADSLGDWKKAVAYYAQAIALWPYSREAYVDIAIAYEKHGLYPLAQAALLKGIAAAPDDGRLHVLLGEAYEAQGERDKAIAQYKVAVTSGDPEIVRISREYFEKIGEKVAGGDGNPQ